MRCPKKMSSATPNSDFDGLMIAEIVGKLGKGGLGAPLGF